MSRFLRANWVVVAWIALIHVTCVFAWMTFTFEGLLVALALGLITAWGITAGFHRLLTHGSYEVPRWLHLTIAFIGGLAGEGPAIQWVAVHRKHHRYSDQPGDPHSPREGPVWAHILWLFRPETAEERDELRRTYAPDLYRDPAIRFLDTMFLPSHALTAVILLLAGWLYGGWMMAASFVVWGMAVRMLCVLHITWCVNSVTHIWGYKNYPNTGDDSRNNAVIGILALGEGWHNNHHASQLAANHGHHWYEVDVTYWSILALTALGLARNVKVYRPRTNSFTTLRPTKRRAAA